MKHAHLREMMRGWFVGDFAPVALRTDVCEVAVKHYNEGDAEALHHHRVATEVTLVVSGEVEMMGRRWGQGDIIVVEPGEATSFHAWTAAACVVVKIPGVIGDKCEGA